MSPMAGAPRRWRWSALLRCVPVRQGVLAALIGLGCSPPPAVRHDWRPEQGIDSLLALSAHQLEALADLTAEASLTIRQGSVNERASALVQVVNPDLLRIEVRGPFLSHVLTAIQQGDSLTVYGPAVGGTWTGAAHGPLMSRLTGFDLAGYDLRYALLGVIAPASADSIAGIEYPRGDRAVVALDGPVGRRRVWIDLSRGFAVREELERPPDGSVLIRSLADYARLGVLYLPRSVELAQGDLRLSIRYRRYRLNQGLAPEGLLDGFADDGP